MNPNTPEIPTGPTPNPIPQPTVPVPQAQPASNPIVPNPAIVVPPVPAQPVATVNPVVQPPVATIQQPAMPSLKPVVGRRIFAAIIDMVGVIIVFFIVWTVFGVKTPAHMYMSAHNVTTYNSVTHLQTTTTVPASDGGTTYSLSPLKGWLFVLVIYVYYILMEWLLGASLGKFMTGIRVRTEEGTKISFVQSLVRNVCRIIDGLPFIAPYLVGFIVMMSNTKHQRIGDKLAKTMVVSSQT